MRLVDAPNKLVLPFANSGGKNTIPVASQIGITNGAASFTDGYPPLTRTPLSAGGVPPFGLDMNGILFDMSAIDRWINSGAGFIYDGTFAADSHVGGYPKGARLCRTDGTGYWLNTVDNNTVDPESTTPGAAAAAGWVVDTTNGTTSLAMSNANVTLSPTQYGKPVIVITGTLTANVNLIFPAIQGRWFVQNSTTGAFAITCKTQSGTGIIVSTSAQLVGDGTNIYNASSPGLQYATTIGVNFSTNTTLTASQLGGWGLFGASVTATLPPLSASPIGSCFTFSGSNFGGTIKGNASEVIFSNINVSANTVAVGVGETITVSSNGSAWYVVEDGFGLASFLNTANVFTQIQTAVTPAQFDDSTKLATTDFVKRSGLQYNGTSGGNFATNTTLTASQLGGWGLFAASVTATLPALASSPVGSCYTFVGGSLGGTIKGNASESIFSTANVSANTLSVGVGEAITVVSNSSGWYVVEDGFGLASFLNTANVFTQIQTAVTPAQLDNSTKLQTTAGANLVGGVVGSSSNLSMSIASASATATITADEIMVETALGGAPIRLSSFSKTINLATTGAGGMDTGAAPASGFVSIYAIYNPTTQTAALLACAQATSNGSVYSGGNMPSGYTASALVSSWPTNGSSQFIIGYQNGRRIWTVARSMVSTSSLSVATTSLSISSVVPSNAISLSAYVAFTAVGAGAGVLSASVGGSSTVIGNSQVTSYTSGFSSSGGFEPVPIITSQTIYYSISISGPASATTTIYCNGYTI